MRKGYSGAQIALHWLVAILVLAQFLLAEGMEEAWDAVERGGTPDTSGALPHIVIGGSILVLALVRLGVRFARGVPGPAEGEGGLQLVAAKVVHGLLYVLMIGLPLGGAAAWYLGIEAAADAHQIGKTLLLILVVLHILGAVYNQWVLRNGLIGRMMRPAD